MKVNTKCTGQSHSKEHSDNKKKKKRCSYLRELMQHAGQFACIGTLSVVLFSPASSMVTPPPRLLHLQAGGPRGADGGTDGGAKSGRSAGQEGQSAG